MTWIDDHKGAGPAGFNFTEQEDKFGYLNNPNWSKDPNAVAFSEAAGNPIDLTNKHQPCGHWHKAGQTTLITPNLYGCGDNHYGQSGSELYGTRAGVEEYVLINNSNFVQVACGYYHSLALKSNGTIWTTGDNNHGVLGQGDTTRRFEWTQIGTDTDWVFIACGLYTSFAIKANGTLWGCGQNNSYQLGINDGVNKPSMTQIGSDTWTMIVGGYLHSVGIKTDGTLWGVGQNTEGQLGQGAGIDERQTFTQIGAATNWIEVGCHEYGTMALNSNNELWGTGYNFVGQLGLGDQLQKEELTQVAGSDWSKLACGTYHTLVIKTDGTLWGAGGNDFGQLGLGPDDVVWFYDEFTQIGTDTDWTDIEAGVYTSNAIKTDPLLVEGTTLWSTGYNGHGNLGLGDYTERVYFSEVSRQWAYVAAGLQTHLAIALDGSLWGAGGNWWGALGWGFGRWHTEFTLINLKLWKNVDTWEDHTLALLNDDGSVWACGENNSAETGIGFVSDSIWRLMQTPAGDNFTQIACGSSHSLIFKDGKIWAVGNGGSGRLGLGDSVSRIIFTQLDGTDWAKIFAGAACSMAIKEDGTLYSTGDNSGGNNGQLGLGDSVDRNEFTQCIGTGWKQCSIGA